MARQTDRTVRSSTSLEGPDGAIYYVDLGYSDDSGQFGVSKIRRIRHVQSNQAPVSIAAGNPTTGSPPLEVTFSSAGSSDPEGHPLTYLWTFGDNTTSTQANPVHTYAEAGMYTARLTVSDGANSTVSTGVNITVGSAPTATILSPTEGKLFVAGDEISYSGDGTDPDDGALPASASAGASTSSTKATCTRALQSPESRVVRSLFRAAVTTSKAIRAIASASP